MKLYFAPDQDCLTPLLAVINNATTTITVADYSYNSPEVTTALIDKYNAGVKVVMLLDKSQSKGKTEIPQLQRLQAAGIPLVIGESDKHKIMHLKVLVGDNTIGFGSYNFTTTAALENNVLAVYTSKPDAQTFNDQINKAIASIQTSKLTIERNQMNYKAIALRAAEVFLVAFVTFLAGSGLNIAHLPALNDLAKVALAGAVVAGDAVYQQVVKPLLSSASAKLGL